MFCGTESLQRGEENTQDKKKIENYEFRASDKIGEGNFSEVFKGTDRQTGKHVAIKVIKYSSLTSKVSEQLLKNQVSILRELNHPNVIKCLDILTSKNHCYIVTEFYEGGDMERFLSRNKYFQEQSISKMVFEIYKGLLYLNDIGIVHRDFKIANIFLTSQGTTKIADFGFAVKSAQPFKDINIGSPIYMSPEGMLLHEYGPKSQVWAFGVMIFELLHGQTPLASCKNQKQLKERVLMPPKVRQGISADLKNLIQRCLTVDPKYRISMKDISQLPYMNRLVNQFQMGSIPKELFSTYHTGTSSSNNSLNFIRQIKTYEEGLAILQYCRLIHKTTQQCPSIILSQWLLNICWTLQKIHPQQGNPEKNQKLINTIKDYYTKYQKEHTQNNFYPIQQDVKKECQKLMIQTKQGILNTASSKLRLNNLTLLVSETDMLIKSLQSGKLCHYAKLSQVEKYLEAIKKNIPKYGAPSTGFQYYHKKK